MKKIGTKSISIRDKIYKRYQKVETLLSNYQLCKAYFNDNSASIIGVVEHILRNKYNLPWQRKFITKATMSARGKQNALIEIPQFNYSERVNDILSKFVKKNFDKMLTERKTKGNYPLILRDVAEMKS